MIEIFIKTLTGKTILLKNLELTDSILSVK